MIVCCHNKNVLTLLFLQALNFLNDPHIYIYIYMEVNNGVISDDINYGSLKPECYSINFVFQ